MAMLYETEEASQGHKLQSITNHHTNEIPPMCYICVNVSVKQISLNKKTMQPIQVDVTRYKHHYNKCYCCAFIVCNTIFYSIILLLELSPADGVLGIN